MALALLLFALGFALPTEREAGSVLYCPDGVYLLSEEPLSLKAFRKGALLRLALPYRRAEWRLSVRYVFHRGRMVREVLKTPRPFPRTQIALIEVCLDGRCQEKPKTAWQTHWDPQSRTLWINLTHRGPLKRVAVRLVFGEGECGGYLYYQKDGLPW
ncbi:MAG TPA: hypothetical protein ENJ76_02930 [Oceanithermus sp.]|nr:hypothetical protein [Oceanithermus sp.]